MAQNNSETLQLLLEQFTNSTAINDLCSKLGSETPKVVHVKGEIGSSLSFLIAGAFKSKKDSHLIIVPTKEEAAYLQNDLQALLPSKPILFFSDSFKKVGQFDRTERTNVLMRTEVIERVHTRSQSKIGEIIITYPEALVEKVVDKSAFQEHVEDIHVGAKLNIDFLNEVFLDWEFERVDFVEEAGQFAIRGGILDIFSFSQEHPLRIELFDDEVESIRYFDLNTQLSMERMKKCTIIPDTHTHFRNAKRDTLLTYLPQKTNYWIKEGELIHHKLEEAQKAIEEKIESLTDLKEEEIDEFWSNGRNYSDMFVSKEDLIDQLSKKNNVEFGGHHMRIPEGIIEMNQSPQASFNKNFEILADTLQRRTAEGYTNFIMSEQPKQIERFYNIFEDIGKTVDFQTISSTLKEGFIDHDLKVALYPDHQIFNRYHKFKMRRSFAKSTNAALKALKELQPGDFIVHIDHGVGKYAGIRKMEKDGVEHEMIRIIYGEADNLYVSINSLHKISKHVGKDGTPPKVHRLGSGQWEKLKNKTKKQVKDIAEDLIRLYAKRKAQKGFQFAPDTYLQNELEASFIYEDTPDQLKATQDVKFDMEQENPMDRLICGDVGFGKTEIAIRAAFKAVADSKQVAILVPTTILAYQHFQTFKERLKDLPCRVDYINRFKTRKEQTQTLKDLESGKIDIIVGTHRLLSKEVKFKDIGLLIIDEEQKFGVAHKEKLKALKVNVDTLTMTATPIPRTLQFSLMGARDLSIIATPPPNRQPVTTEVQTFNHDLIADAINYEVARGGQTFFIHNRVKDIQDMSILIQGLCPHVKVVTAHGQMDGKELEKIFLSFLEGKYDVLLATSLIESGIDISNVNTILINNAQNFGLSDLHQLRGRVGRSNKKAFCYLLAPPVYSLSGDAKKRLQTIEEFSDLGGGINIAMRDMDIRGAGNILGGEQSGFVSEMGIELYHKILEEALQELKETEFKDLFKAEILRKQEFVRDAQVETDFEILIPDNYINNINERLSIYTRLDHAKTEEQLNQFEKELKDRFGPIPKQVQEIFGGIRVRWTCRKLGIERLILKKGKMKCIFTSNQSSPFYESFVFTNLLNYVQNNSNRCQLKQTPKYLMLNVDMISTLKKANEFLSKVLEQTTNVRV